MKNLFLKILAGLVLFLIMFGFSSSLYLDYEWFKSHSILSTFTILLFSKMKVHIIFAVIFIIIFALNSFIIFLLNGRNFVPRSFEKFSFLQKYKNYVWLLFIGMVLFLAFISGSFASVNWEDYLLFMNSSETLNELTDPILNKPISFYFFALPFYTFVFWWLTVSMVIISVFSIFYHIVNGSLYTDKSNVIQFKEPFKQHMLLTASVFLALFAISYRLDLYDLLFIDRDKFFGPGYTAAHSKKAAIYFCMYFMLFISFITALSAAAKKYILTVIIIPIALLICFLAGNIIPFLQQSFSVVPNELDKELPYIKNNIDFTLKAYNLDNITEYEFPNDVDLTYNDITANSDVIENIRLWDWQPLNATYKQLQELKPYYKFYDVDVDRYIIDGSLRAVNIAGRELNIEEMDSGSRSWVNEHLVFTHGYGIVMNRVDQITKEGMPNMLVKDIPPKSTINFKLDRPEIYYGELNNPYIITNTSIKPGEFDYPFGEENKFTTYQGTGGLEINGFLKKLFLSIALGDMNLLISENINDKSRLHLFRNIMDIAEKVTPYLMYDYDPYIVVADGKIYWFIDCFTYSDSYPYSAYTYYEGKRINYIRNSAKLVIDAYNGSFTYYIIDNDDPIISTYSKIFKGLFKDISEMPESLKEHLRYPETLFKIQNTVMLRYHMTNPNVFYNNEDMWAIPKQIYEDSETTVEPFYAVTRLPNAKQTEFILMRPFTPNSKNNMIGFVVAKCDKENYGKLELYRLPKEKLNYGPMQIEARINQDADISKQLTLWGQKGSKVIRGNMYTIPIKNSILFVESLYIKAETSEMPELKRVILALGDTIVMEENLPMALSALFGNKNTTISPDETGSNKTITNNESATIKELVEKAYNHYQNSENYIKQGNWSAYGQEQLELKNTLEELKKK